jgi:chemotaxis protein MotB
MAHHKVKLVKDNMDRWLLTYADLMNLLLIFFIILYAMSNIDSAKYEQLSKSLKAALGRGTVSSFAPITGRGPSVIDRNATSASPVLITSAEQQRMNEIGKKLSELIKNENLAGKIKVSSDERGIVISITAKLLFNPGSADIIPLSRPTIKDIGTILKNIPGNQISVEGHTDSDPIHNSYFSSNWQLSAMRAANIVELLVNNSYINPKDIRSAGYGEERPVAPNDTPANKAKNRRVDIVILKSEFNKAEPQVLNNP